MRQSIDLSCDGSHLAACCFLQAGGLGREGGWLEAEQLQAKVQMGLKTGPEKTMPGSRSGTRRDYRKHASSLCGRRQDKQHTIMRN